MTRRLAIAAVVCLACEGAPSGTSVAGSGPTPFTGVEAFSTTGSGAMLSSDPSAPLDVTWTTIVVASEPGACDRVAAQTIEPGSSTVQLYVARISTDPIPPGTYELGRPSPGDTTPLASVSLATVDASCALSAAPRLGKSGTVTFTRTGVGGVSGEVEVTLDDGTRLAGTFDAPGCAAASGVGYPNTFACGP